MCDQPGPLPPHYLSITLQAADDPSPGFVARGWCLGIGSTNFFPANRDGLAQSGPCTGPLRACHGQRHSPVVELPLPSFILPRLQHRHAVFTMPSASHPAFRLGRHVPHFLPSIDSHLFHLLPHLAGRKEAGASGRSSHVSSVPTTFTRRTIPPSVTWTSRTRSRRLQPPGSSNDEPGSGENK